MTPRFFRHPLVAAVGFAATIASAAASAASASTARDEIDHLLDYVASSSCTFVRNGSEYPAEKARDHLAIKYRFVGDRIATAEDFIKYLASGSSVSGEPYHVKCGKTDALAGAWLNAELNRYRNSPHVQRVAQ
ncbi:MAG TPA: DUF5329 domain-containing protein [Casimicrobiaceae bacterium]|nr:DUF5329 domain-containing protein [Casimicrobiaceae bacterium]